MKKTLKFLSWMFILLLMVSVSSCKDDEEGHPFAGTTWEYSRMVTYYANGKRYDNATKTWRISFTDETNATYEEEYKDATGGLLDNFPSPYTYRFSNSLVIFDPVKIGDAALEGTVVERVKMTLINTTSSGENKEIATLYKK